MRTLMFALATVAPLAIVAPAAAQDVGVRVGPFEAGVGRAIMKGGVITIITVIAA